jgi:murein L,D-transpeptidase YafK
MPCSRLVVKMGLIRRLRHKQQAGDERTPEGKYILDYKKQNSSFYKAIHISYPNEQDKKRAYHLGVDPGGLIMIHGQKNGLG